MNKEQMMAEVAKAEAHVIVAREGSIYSINPPETLFGFTYHAHMIPPFKPNHTLILGYGGGTIPALMRKIWGLSLRITGVDTQRYPNEFNEYKIIQMDAWKYIKDCTTGIFKKKFDFICVDLWDGDKVPDIVFTHEFAVRLASMVERMVCCNVQREKTFQFKKMIDEYTPLIFERGDLVGGNVVLWWSVPIEK